MDTYAHVLQTPYTRALAGTRCRRGRAAIAPNTGDVQGEQGWREDTITVVARGWPGGMSERYAHSGLIGKVAMTAQAVDRRSPLPLWSQVQNDLRRRAGTGEFDQVFPGENLLVSQYEVSRNTVREALRALRAEGLVSAERGRAPRLVRGGAIRQPVGTLYSLFASVEAAGLRQSSLVRALDVRADGVIAARLGLEESTPLVYLERLRLAGDDPLALDRVWLPASLAEPLLEADFTHTSLYDELATRTVVRLEGGQEQITAVVPTRAEQALLRCPQGTAAFEIERTGRMGASAVEWRQTVVRGDRFVFQADFSAGAYRLAVSSTVPAGGVPVAG